MARILILEDDLEQAFLMGKRFEAAGHVVKVVGTAQDAIQSVADFSPDVAVVDLVVRKDGVPVPDGGVTFIHDLDIHYSRRKIPIVVVSALAPHLKSGLMKRTCVVDVLEKPVDLALLGVELHKFDRALPQDQTRAES